MAFIEIKHAKWDEPVLELKIQEKDGSKTSRLHVIFSFPIS